MAMTEVLRLQQRFKGVNSAILCPHFEEGTVKMNNRLCIVFHDVSDEVCRACKVLMFGI
jgi:hypothetical protein